MPSSFSFGCGTVTPEALASLGRCGYRLFFSSFHCLESGSLLALLPIGMQKVQVLWLDAWHGYRAICFDSLCQPLDGIGPGDAMAKQNVGGTEIVSNQVLASKRTKFGEKGIQASEVVLLGSSNRIGTRSINMAKVLVLPGHPEALAVDLAAEKGNNLFIPAPCMRSRRWYQLEGGTFAPESVTKIRVDSSTFVHHEIAVLQ
mmetsp:Transcript_46495/g.122789  ORF Transcript_46495/g.122789 Transcript_46495/m.122789 type:complete len:202 (+) Transcript_46495:310-915(+)